MTDGILYMGTGKTRCRNEHQGVRCPYRADAHPKGGCPTRKRRLALAVKRGQGTVLRLDPEAVDAAAQLLELLKKGADLKQTVCTEAFMRFSVTVLRAAERTKKAAKR